MLITAIVDFARSGAVDLIKNMCNEKVNSKDKKIEAKILKIEDKM